jgi:hypothetical protein
MVSSFGQHAGDDPALLRHFQTFLDAQFFQARGHGFLGFSAGLHTNLNCF